MSEKKEYSNELAKTIVELAALQKEFIDDFDTLGSRLIASIFFWIIAAIAFLFTAFLFVIWYAMKTFGFVGGIVIGVYLVLTWLCPLLGIQLGPWVAILFP